MSEKVKSNIYIYQIADPEHLCFNRACKSRARKRGWGQLEAEGPNSPC